MNIIYKYELNSSTLRIKGFLQFLDSQLQSGRPVVWVLRDTTDKKVSTFDLTRWMTGEPILPTLGKHLFTYETNGFVQHVFAKEV